MNRSIKNLNIIFLKKNIKELDYDSIEITIQHVTSHGYQNISSRIWDLFY